MIICNGTIEVESVSGGGVDEYGRPFRGASCWSSKMRCRIETIYDTRKGTYEDGKYRHASFYILIDGLRRFSCRRVRLHRFGELLGEYDVLKVEPLEAVCATKVTV